VTSDIGELPSDERLPIGAQESIFRIAQEGLGNVARHARAQNVHVRLHVIENGANATDDYDCPFLLLEIRDDGQGFDTLSPSSGMGLNNMRTRAARLGAALEIDSAPNAGTSLRMNVPLVLPKAQAHDELVMTADTKRRLNRAIAARWIGVLVSILVVAFVTRQGRYGALLGLTRDQIILGFQILAAVMVAGVVGAFIYAWQTMKPVIVSAGSESTAAYKYRYHVHRGLTVVFGACIVFLPVLPLESGTPEGFTIALAIAAMLAVPMVYELVKVYALYDRYLHTLPPAELKQEIDHRWKQNLSNWFTVGALLFIAVAMSYNRLAPPVTVDGWLTTFADLTVLSIVISHAGETWYYRRWRKRLGDA
jgi:hypothetical protein